MNSNLDQPENIFNDRKCKKMHFKEKRIQINMHLFAKKALVGINAQKLSEILLKKQKNAEVHLMIIQYKHEVVTLFNI